MAESRIEEIMRILDLSEEEAKEMLAYDEEIDRDKGDKKQLEFDISPEKAKIAKKMANVKTHKHTGVYDLKRRERKPNPTKRSIITYLANALNEFGVNAIVSNAEKMIDFSLDGHEYSLNLVQHREGKGK